MSESIGKPGLLRFGVLTQISHRTDNVSTLRRLFRKIRKRRFRRPSSTLFRSFFFGGEGGFLFVGICMLNPSEPTWPSRLLLKWHVQTDWEARWALAGVSLLNGVSRQRELRLLSNLLGKSLQSECPEEVIACLMLHYHAYFPIPERRRSQDATILEPFLWQIAEILLPFVDDRLISSLITYIGAFCIFRRDLNPPSVPMSIHG